MGSSTEAAAADSDGSISWEEFIGTTTDLVPQLLGMFDEIARGKSEHCNILNNNNNNHHSNVNNNLHYEDDEEEEETNGCGITQASRRHRGAAQGSTNNNTGETTTKTTAASAAAALLQKRLSLAQLQQQISRCTSLATAVEMAPASLELIRHADDTDTDLSEDEADEEDEEDEEAEDEDDGVVVYSPRLQHDDQRFAGSCCCSHCSGVGGSEKKRCHHHQQQKKKKQRPVSIASSSSSSSCGSSSCQGSHHHRKIANHHHHHHHHHHCSATQAAVVASAAANPYLASVESLADTCASSQGSGDSGVVTTISDNSSGCKILLAEVERATAARYFDERRPRYCDPHLSPVERVLLEIVITENDYVEDLLQVIQGYLIFWRNDPESLVHDLELNGLFSNIEDIFEFNSKFLSALEKNPLDPVAVANTFIEHNTGFKVYTEYCTNYPRTVSILTDLMNQEKIGRAFRERQAALGHNLPLGSFLLKPVQRILKYHLLLDKLTKGFAAIEPEPSGVQAHEEGKATIENALRAMNGIAEYINEMKRKHEHAVRVQEIQSLLYGWHGPDLTTSGELIAEGSFRMRGAKAPRHAFLFDKMLLLTKKREDGLLVYKAHILCSNLTLMESIPGEPLSFHVIPFDNSQIQYKLQARNLEQKREWTLQIKRVILENYSAVIPSHARQLVLQIGQKSEDDYTPERGHKNYFERKPSRERRKSEIGIRQKFRKGRKSDMSLSTAENSPMSPRKNQSTESISQFGSRDENLNRSSEIRGSKIKDRFTNWRRKSEPGFQSYINLNPSDNEEDAKVVSNGSDTLVEDSSNNGTETHLESEISESSTTPSNSPSVETKESNGEEPIKERENMEEIVSNILMQKEEFQKRLEKHLQRNQSILHNSILKYNHSRQDTIIDSSEDEEYTDAENKTNEGNNNRLKSRVSRREQCFVRAVNAYNQRSFRSQYDSFRNVDAKDSADLIQRLNSTSTPLKSTTRSSNHEKRSPGEAFRKPNIIMGSKLMRTALRIREDCDSASEHEEAEEPIYETPMIVKKSNDDVKNSSDTYDNLQHSWNGCLETDDGSNQESPNKAAVWLTKLCEGLPDQPQKCGSLPRSFQMMNPADLNHVSKSRFLQRDGKSMTERPFTIASDKPAEINLEDMERYASNCQGSTRIAKFPTTSSTSTSIFFCSLDDASFTDTESITKKTSLSTSTYVHPDHKIYRADKSCTKELNNGTTSLTSSSLLSVFSRAGSRLKSSQSTEVLECTEEIDRSSRYFRSFGKRNKHKSNGTKSTEVEEIIGCVPSNSKLRLNQLPYHKHGSSSIGARIAQSDYADPLVLFSENRKISSNLNGNTPSSKDTSYEEVHIADTLESDSFYEKSFETIEDYAETQEETFRDSAIFSDVDDSSLKSNENSSKVPPPVPEKRKIRRNVTVGEKPAVVQKPAHLKLRARLIKSKVISVKTPTKENNQDNENLKEDDVSAGQSQVGYVKKMIGQLQLARADA